jgi:hypothetical protein
MTKITLHKIKKFRIKQKKKKPKEGPTVKSWVSFFYFLFFIFIFFKKNNNNDKT